MTPIVTPLTPEQTAIQEKQVDNYNYLHRLLIGLDDFTNVVVFNGECDETISAHTARMAMKHEFVGVVMSKALDLIQKNHGAKAIAGDTERAKTIINIEENSGAINVPASPQSS